MATDTKKAPSSATVEAMLTIDDLCRILCISRRAVERLRAAGKVPPPDLVVCKRPRWKGDTIRGWIDSAKGI